jgi:DNA polymerase III delta prime subunit
MIHTAGQITPLFFFFFSRSFFFFFLWKHKTPKTKKKKLKKKKKMSKRRRDITSYYKCAIASSGHASGSFAKSNGAVAGGGGGVVGGGKAELPPAFQDQQPWTERHRPKTLTDIVGNARGIQTLKGWFARRKRGDATCPLVALISGPPGIGKTCAAHAAFVDGGLEGYEIDTVEVRTVPLLLCEIQRVATVGMIPGLHKTRSGVIVDEADGIFTRAHAGGLDAEKWKTHTVEHLVKQLGDRDVFPRTGTAPIIFICNDTFRLRSLIAMDKLVLHVPFYPPFDDDGLELAGRVLGSQDGALVPRQQVDAIVREARGDVRQIVTRLEMAARDTDMLYDAIDARNQCSTAWANQQDGDTRALASAMKHQGQSLGIRRRDGAVARERAPQSVFDTAKNVLFARMRPDVNAEGWMQSDWPRSLDVVQHNIPHVFASSKVWTSTDTAAQATDLEDLSRLYDDLGDAELLTAQFSDGGYRDHIPHAASIAARAPNVRAGGQQRFNLDGSFVRRDKRPPQIKYPPSLYHVRATSIEDRVQHVPYKEADKAALRSVPHEQLQDYVRLHDAQVSREKDKLILHKTLGGNIE